MSNAENGKSTGQAIIPADDQKRLGEAWYQLPVTAMQNPNDLIAKLAFLSEAIQIANIPLAKYKERFFGMAQQSGLKTMGKIENILGKRSPERKLTTTGWLVKHLDAEIQEHGGKWIAVIEDKVVASNRSLRKLRQEIEATKLEFPPYIALVPKRKAKSGLR